MTRRTRDNILFAVIIILGCLIAAGCSTASKAPASPKGVPMAQAVPQIDESVHRSNAALLRAYEAVCDMTVETFATVRPVVLAFLDEAKTANADTTKKVAVAVESVKADAKADAKREEVVAAQAKEIKQLKQADPVRSWLRWIGGALLLASTTLLVASFFYVFLAAFRPLAVMAGVVGAVAVTLAQYLPLIEQVIAWTLAAAGVAGLALLAWYLWIHQREIKRWVTEEKEVGTLAEVAARQQGSK